MIVDQYGNKIKLPKKKVNFNDRYYNATSGAGGYCDKSQNGYFGYSYLADNKELLEYAYAGSWAAAKIINIPVDDMFVHERIILNEDGKVLERLEKFNTEFDLSKKIKQAIKSARLFGTAFLVLISNDRRLSKPINFDSPILDLKNILVLDRFDASILQYDRDITSKNYGHPLVYSFSLKWANTIQVHHTRVIRIDAIKPLSINSWESLYNQDWGISELVRSMSSIENEESIASAVNYLLQESSVTNIKIEDLQDALAGAPDSYNIDNLVGNINDYKSIYRTLYLDKTMDIDRLEASFSNIPQLFDKYNLRLSAAADIPQTRFFGRSPSGLDSNGDSDMHNYAVMISAMQANLLKPIYDKLDKFILRDFDIEKIEYKFKPLLDISDLDKAEKDLKDAQRDKIYLESNVISSEDIRQTLKDNKIYSDLELSNKIENNKKEYIINNENQESEGF